MRCPTCQSETSVFDENCSRCDAPNGALRRGLAWKAAAGVVLAAGLAVYFLGGPSAPTRRVDMSDIYQQVSSDAKAQYMIAKRQGDAIPVCAHAGLVAAAYLQAQDESSYRQWKSIESDDCAKAGAPK